MAARSFKIATLLLALLNCEVLRGQSSTEISVRGGFLVDSIQLGVPAPFAVVALYPVDRSVIFVDSTYDFSPFEWSSMQYFTSELRDGKIYDSALYYLSSFDVQEVQWLRLPIKVAQSSDTLSFYTNNDTILIKGLLSPSLASKEEKLKAQVNFQKVNLAFNYPILIWILSGSCLLGGIMFLLLRRPIRRWWKLRHIKRRHKRFRSEFEIPLQSLEKAYHVSDLQLALFLWKKYLEKLEKKPYQNMSTTEICALASNNSLSSYLVPLDAALYGSRNTEECLKHLEQLLGIADDRYYRQLQHTQLYG